MSEEKFIEPFKVPIYNIKLNLDNNLITEIAYNLKKESKGREVSNLGGWQSDDLDFEIDKLQSLYLEMFNNVHKFASSIDINNKMSITNAWININKYKDSNLLHFHPNCFFSGVYYVKTPKNSGNLVFYNPAFDGIEYAWDLTNKKFFNSYNSSVYTVVPEEGDLYIFPGWLKHLVRPNMSKQDRITIAFNCK